MLDYIIRGGSILDGSGEEGYCGDIAVADGVIVAVGGAIREPAREVIDADGAIVTPAWIDLHTHYDGQVTWDEAMEPSAGHGVGTVIMGNCGVGFAPVLPHGESDLIDLMEGVEDIPGTALHEAMPWGAWETYPQYLDYLDGRRYAIDVSSMITHGTVRNYVMGGPQRANAPANAAEIERMAAIVEEALRAGAVGFSTSRVSGHRSIHGDLVPGTFAPEQELTAIAAAMGRAGAGVFQAIPAGSFNWNGDGPSIEEEIEMMCRLSVMSGRKATFSLVAKQDSPDEWRDVVALAKAGNSRGAQVFAQVGSRPTSFVFSLATYHPFMARPSCIALAHLPLATRAAEMRKPEVKARILGETDVATEFPGKMTSLIPTIPFMMEQSFPLRSDSNYEPDPEESFAAAAMKDGLQDGRGHLYDHLVQGGGTNFAVSFIANYGHFNIDHIREMQLDESTVVGLSDAGAHVCAVLDAVCPTYQLAYWARDRRRGLKLPLPHVVARQTSRNADLFGFSDRGRLAPGMRADLNVIDFDNLGLGDLEVRQDLPAGGSRLMQDAHGYLASMVKGQLIRRMDQDTGNRPGRLLRGKVG